LPAVGKIFPFNFKFGTHFGELPICQNRLAGANQLPALNLFLLGSTGHEREAENALWFFANSLDEVRLDNVRQDHLRQFRTRQAVNELDEIKPSGTAAAVMRQAMEELWQWRFLPDTDSNGTPC
jgi:hypothetical protein